MANYALLAVGVGVIGILTFAVPMLLAEVFPWQLIRRQHFGRPTMTTKSYKGRTVLITGANGAYGSRAAKLFAHRDVETLVLVDVRDCATVKEEIEKELRESGKTVMPNIVIWQADIMTFAGCQEIGKKAREQLKALDHVLLTAGILAFDCRQSPEGWETTIQVNFLSTALVALLLLPLLKPSPGNPNPPVLTFVTSFGIYPAAPSMWSLPKDGGSYLKSLNNTENGMKQAQQYGMKQAQQYGISKGLLLYFTRELAKRVSVSGDMRKVTINSADPGSAWTPLTQPNGQMLIPRLIMNFSSRDPQFGAIALVNGASASEDAHGKILHDFDTASYPPFMERKTGRQAQKRVWEEARKEFEAKVPEVKAVYRLLTTTRD
ncbi:hypothetical protein B0H66DRAFT_642935 [Apodospora peruviana]|uniref:Uncharacterized protein n=1 Tax=Apodospora peruviana TaxID=516989 RepID=A0AAE0HVI5_9PEZI|nr:hypothetical protein B0H66DRAFT_642935 [Apodospora peruviana]